MSNEKKDEHLSIPDFFKGKSIFITGGSGFVGRVLIEKLLRSCSNLENIYMLIRPKKNASIEERIRRLTDVPLFDKLRNENKNFLDKIIPVNGNIKELKLGISEKDRERIINNVSIIYNSAASVRFDEALKDAVLTNVRSTREIMNLAQELKTLDAVVHISTLYANADHMVIEEKLYPRHDWQDAINLVENSDESVLEVLTQKYIHPLPNTYTFTKSIAELLVNDYCDNKIPVVIIRPSIVIPTSCDPFVGWIDNFNGPIGLNIAVAKGITKIVYADSEVKLDYVFVDNVVKSIIVATWKKSLDFKIGKKDMMVCNVSSDAFVDHKANEPYYEIVRKNPPETYIGSVNVSHTKCWYNFFLRVLILHILPAILLDVLLAVSGKKLRILKFRRRIYIANMAVLRFLMNEWESKNDNYLSLYDTVTGTDKKNFSIFRLSGKCEEELIMEKFWPAAKMYLLKEKPMATKSEVKRYQMFQLAGKILNYAFLGFILYLVIWRYDSPTKTYKLFYDYISNLDT